MKYWVQTNMKDRDVALIVVGLAGLAFLMSKATNDRPAENQRGVYQKTVDPEDTRPLDSVGENLERMKTTSLN